MKLNARQLRSLSEKGISESIERQPLYFIVDNLYDTYNIGGLFRLGDALNIAELLICGNSETPPNHKIEKASIGTYKVVPWRYYKTTTQAIKALRSQVPDIKIVAIEQDKKAVPYTEFTFTTPLAFIAGHETHGITPEVLKEADAIVTIPMHGINISLNVIVATGIVAYHAVASLDIYHKKGL